MTKESENLKKNMKPLEEHIYKLLEKTMNNLINQNSMINKVFLIVLV